MSEKLVVSQSLLNKYLEYKDGKECGELIDLSYIKKLVKMKKTDPMRMGERFEYEAVKNKDYDGNIPEPFFNKNGTPSQKQYNIAGQVSNFKEWFTKNEYEIIAHGERYDFEFDNFILSGMIDLVFKDKNGKIYLCDLKMSGRLNDSESDWGWHPETILNHLNKRNQMIIYLMLGHLTEKYKTDTFVFYVAHSQNQLDYTPFEITVTSETFEKESQRIMDLAKEIAFEYELGLTPRPSAARCSSCPANEICTKKDSDQSGNLKLTF